MALSESGSLIAPYACARRLVVQVNIMINKLISVAYVELVPTVKGARCVEEAACADFNESPYYGSDVSHFGGDENAATVRD